MRESAYLGTPMSSIGQRMESLLSAQWTRLGLGSLNPAELKELANIATAMPIATSADTHFKWASAVLQEAVKQRFFDDAHVFKCTMMALQQAW